MHRRFVFAALAVFATGSTAPTAAAEPSPDRVEVVYFHRTVRCPTCQKVGAAVETAVAEAFPQELAAGRVVLRFVDFQSSANAAETAAAKVASPTLVAKTIRGGKVVAAEPLPAVWGLLRKPAALADYVEQAVRERLPEASR